MWLLVGISATISPFVWDRISRRLGRLNTLKIAFGLGVVGNLVLATSQGIVMTGLAALIFGFTFMGIVSLTLSTVGKLYGLKATQVMARLTLGYCIAQILSPIISGTIAEATGSFKLSLYIISAIMILGMVCLLALRSEHKELQQNLSR